MIYLYNWSSFNEWELRRSFFIDETVLINLLNQHNHALIEYVKNYHGHQSRNSDPIYEKMKAITKLTGLEHPNYRHVMYTIYTGTDKTPTSILNIPSPMRSRL